LHLLLAVLLPQWQPLLLWLLLSQHSPPSPQLLLPHISASSLLLPLLLPPAAS
jgi:hypothetical protein